MPLCAKLHINNITESNKTMTESSKINAFSKRTGDGESPVKQFDLNGLRSGI